MRRSMYSVALMTIIRDKDTAKREFVEAAHKLSTMIFNEAMSLLPHTPRYRSSLMVASEKPAHVCKR